jgi:hypothetical protein
LAFQGGSILALVGACILGACASGQQSSGGQGNNNNGSSGGQTSSGGTSGGGFTAGTTGGTSSGIAVPPCSSNCTDFPSSPIIDTNTPSNASTYFGSPGNSGGPCLVEPVLGNGNTPGALFPNNWLRPEFVIAPGSGQNIFEIQLHNSIEANDLIVYTTATTWKMPAMMWAYLAGHVQDSPITVTITGASMSGGSAAVGSTGTFTIAPAGAGGSMVYWAAAGMDMSAMNTQLKGFHVGDEGTVSALQTNQVQMKVRATWGTPSGDLKDQTTAVQCIGCHTATPDGDYAAFIAQWPWPGVIAGVTSMNVGQPPSYLGAGAVSNLSPNTMGAYNYNSNPDVSPFMLGVPTFSKMHFGAGDYTMVTSEGSAWYTPPATGNTTSCTNSAGCATGTVAQLAWFDLTSTTAGTGFGQIPRTGDTTVNGQTCPGGGECSAGAPNWSHDGNNILYVSTDYGVEDGRMGHGNTDVKIVPYNNKQGGAVQSVSGASDPAYNEYYPAWSPDDQMIAFNRVAAGGNMFIEPTAEVYVVPASQGATATRLAANDPASCTGQKSPGINNSWPKWCPTSTTVGSKTYYWLIFGSRRTIPGNPSNAQLYVAGVVNDGGNVTTYPAIYVWNQDATLNNEIPAWDNFQIPPVTVQ